MDGDLCLVKLTLWCGKSIVEIFSTVFLLPHDECRLYFLYQPRRAERRRKMLGELPFSLWLVGLGIIVAVITLAWFGIRQTHQELTDLGESTQSEPEPIPWVVYRRRWPAHKDIVYDLTIREDMPLPQELKDFPVWMRMFVDDLAREVSLLLQQYVNLKIDSVMGGYGYQFYFHSRRSLGGEGALTRWAWSVMVNRNLTEVYDGDGSYLLSLVVWNAETNEYEFYWPIPVDEFFDRLIELLKQEVEEAE